MKGIKFVDVEKKLAALIHEVEEIAEIPTGAERKEWAISRAAEWLDSLIDLPPELEKRDGPAFRFILGLLVQHVFDGLDKPKKSRK